MEETKRRHLTFQPGQTYRVKTTFWAHPIGSLSRDAKCFELNEKIVVYSVSHVRSGFGGRKIYYVNFYDLTGQRYTAEYKFICNEVVPL